MRYKLDIAARVGLFTNEFDCKCREMACLSKKVKNIASGLMEQYELLLCEFWLSDESGFEVLRGHVERNGSDIVVTRV